MTAHAHIIHHHDRAYVVLLLSTGKYHHQHHQLASALVEATHADVHTAVSALASWFLLAPIGV
jgi:hypothetical protein